MGSVAGGLAQPWRALACSPLLLILTFTLAINQAAFLNWFQDDDFDNLSWGPVENLSTYAKVLVSPVFHRDTFRPVGHIMYHVLGRTARLNYAWYEAWLLAGHLVNVALLWRLLRKLNLDQVAAAAGTLFFAFHQACFFAYWRPMYVFDVYSTTFCLLAILAYLADRWIVSLACFWIAYRAKELVIMLPVVLLAWECFSDWKRFLDEKRWLRLLPFFAVSASFGLQAIYANRTTNDTYSIRLTPAAVWECLEFYAARFLFPYSAFGLFLLPVFFRRDRRVWLGVVAFWAFLTPMLAFPDRRIAVYLYLPLAGAAMALAAVVAQARARIPALALLGVWMIVCWAALVRFESLELADAADHRNIARTLQTTAIRHPEITYYVFEGLPKRFAPWGLGGALSAYIRAQTGKRPDIHLEYAGAIKTGEFANRIPAALFTWNQELRRASILEHTAGWRDWSYLPMTQGIPIWQLGAGFTPIIEGNFRWIADHAEARVYRPADARLFELVVDAGDLVARKKRSLIQVKLDGDALEPREIADLLEHRLRWDLAEPASAGRSVPVTIDVDGWFQADPDPRRLAVRVLALGFR